MKVTVQNGCNHCLTRKEVESLISLFPSCWSDKVKSIVLYQGEDESNIEIEYYKKEKILSVYCASNKNNSTSKALAIEEILIALYCITNSNNSPNSISKSIKSEYYYETSTLREQCKKRVFK